MHGEKPLFITLRNSKRSVRNRDAVVPSTEDITYKVHTSHSCSVQQTSHLCGRSWLRGRLSLKPAALCSCRAFVPSSTSFATIQQKQQWNFMENSDHMENILWEADIRKYADTWVSSFAITRSRRQNQLDGVIHRKGRQVYSAMANIF
jgi:hypothetical protein